MDTGENLEQPSGPQPPPLPGHHQTAVAEPRAGLWRWWIHLILIGGYILLPVLHRHRHHPTLTHSTRGLLSVSIIDLVIFTAIFAIAWVISRASREQMFLPWRPGWWVVPLGLFYSVAMRMAIIGAVLVFVLILFATKVVTPNGVNDFVHQHQPNFHAIVDTKAMRTNPAYYWLTITLISFINAGLREELWRAGTLAGLRALFPRLFGTFNGQVVAVAIIAVLFGTAHLYMGGMGAVAAGILGLMLGLIMIWHRSIWPAMFAHAFLDATTFAFLPYLAERFQQM